MRTISVKTKIFLMLSTLAALFVALGDWLAYRQVQANLVASAHQQADALLSHVSREMVIGGAWLPTSELARVINFHLHLRPQVVSIMVFDQHGSPLQPKTKQAFHANYASLLGKPEKGMVGAGEGNLHAVIFPVEQGRNFLGSIIGLLDLSDMAGQVESVRRLFWWLGLTTWLLLIMALYAAFNLMILNPIQRLNRVSKQLAQGDHQARATVESGDEIGGLATSFNQMADHLVKAIESAEGEKNRLQAVLDTQGDALFVVDTQKRITMINRRLSDLLGKPNQEILGRPCFELIHSDLCRLGCQLFDEDQAGPGSSCPADLEAVLGLADGRRVPIRKNANVIRNSAGVVVGGVETFRDISLEKELANLRQEWDAFIRHELRTPLQPILGFSRLLAKDFDRVEPDKRIHYVEIIQGSAQHLARLLDLTREVQLYEAGKIKLALTQLDLVRTLTQAADGAWNGLAGKRGQPEPGPPAWALVIEPGLDTVIVQDPVKLARVFLNLLENAWEHDPEPVRVEVAAIGPDQLEVTLCNGGEPIPPERLKTIFEKYNTTKSGRGGTGLGTTIARLFVQAHGGVITATSSAEAGTCFRVRLPRVGPGGAPAGERV